ncbi:hypothetical protein SOM11_13850 [Frigoribacterium sp. CFBP9039]|uniref:hypothetical protein n=1 Tax=Frigoribacterium TaxID=96492 RepID=UPI0017831DAD|nr:MULTISPECIES: hypothetical protein [Frigoribacterium]MBD8704015.1 hypothetical protein [Frigoribacterium sp. CFBP 13712]MCJ0702280.1 hypothetical protein [Frigoribacterium faeni]MDY0947076.1 hypothetical protein [Frigoribacterium sp. CFBP9039]
MNGLRITLFHARQLLRTPFFLQQALVAPCIFVALRVLGSLGADTPLTASLWLEGSIAGIWATTTTAVGIISYQRFQGTLEHMALSTLRPGVVFGSLCAAAATIGLLGIPLALGLQLAVTGHVHVDLRDLVSLAASFLACMSSALVLAAFFLVSRSATVLEPLLLTPIWLLSGIVVPLSSFPWWIVPVAAIHPLVGAVAVGHSTGSVALVWLLESVGMSALWATAAWVLLITALRRARRDGTLALA